MISHVIEDAPFVPDAGEQVIAQYMTYRIMHRRQPTGDAGVLIITTHRIVFYRSGASGLSLAFNFYHPQKITLKKGSVAGSKYVEFNGYRVYLGRKESKLAYKLAKFGRRGKVKQMLSLVPARARPQPRVALRPPVMQQPAYQPRPAAPQSNLSTDAIYRKGLEAVADDIVNQIVPKSAASAPGATQPQSVTTVSASRSMVMRPTVKTAEAITSAEAVAAKRAMLERVLAPQSSEA
ncbi:MAG: hypothetical protein JW839_18640, partial [Candidatus Lokiarchaeota archaeon]|nr:hypothetical protein [Candidatus Lokiarchaeota archaeon]